VTAPAREEGARLARWTLLLALVGVIASALAFASDEIAALAIVGFIAAVTGLLLGIAAWTGPGARTLAAVGTTLNFFVVGFWVVVGLLLARG
jgi:hypothetical protein